MHCGPRQARPQTFQGGMNMSFYSYKNANSDTCPGVVSGNILSGLNQRV